MALCHIPRPPLFTSRELNFFPSATKLEERLRWGVDRRSPACRALLSCSAKNSRANRKSRAKKSNAELCNELREFVSAVGLREPHVPSTKELLEHGRKDLANIVRHRGYKEITKLLMNPTNGETSSVKALANGNYFGKVSTEEPVEGQETQGNLYNTQAESLHEGVTSCSQNGELETIGESEDTLFGNGHEFCSTMDSTNGVDDGAVAAELSSPLSRGQNSSRDDVSSEEILGNSDFDKNKASDLAEVRANEAEINHLKELLHQKERELALLKQQIEEAKYALSVMQSKVHSETRKVRNMISTKDKELNEAEEKLSGLIEVLIKYWGNGETVEVTGNFNGWQHRIKMNPHTSSTTANQTGPRDDILWSTILWLYPGIYEIKFVVDGHWRIDSQREFITRGDIRNNILRVER